MPEPDADVTGLEGEREPTFVETMGLRGAAFRQEYPDLRLVDIDALFVGFLIECASFGVFNYGPLTIDVSVVEERFARTYDRVAPGEETGGYHDSARRFYRLVAEELERGGRKRLDELHWLLAFMRAGEGLPAEVFGELGVTVEEVETFSERRTQPPEAAARSSAPEKLYSPEEVAEYFGIHVETVRGWIRSGRLPASRLAGQRVLRVRESDLESILEPVQGPAPGDED